MKHSFFFFIMAWALSIQANQFNYKIDSATNYLQTTVSVASASGVVSSFVVASNSIARGVLSFGGLVTNVVFSGGVGQYTNALALSNGWFRATVGVSNGSWLLSGVGTGQQARLQAKVFVSNGVPANHLLLAISNKNTGFVFTNDYILRSGKNWLLVQDYADRVIWREYAASGLTSSAAAASFVSFYTATSTVVGTAIQVSLESKDSPIPVSLLVTKEGFVYVPQDFLEALAQTYPDIFLGPTNGVSLSTATNIAVYVASGQLSASNLVDIARWSATNQSLLGEIQALGSSLLVVSNSVISLDLKVNAQSNAFLLALEGKVDELGGSATNLGLQNPLIRSSSPILATFTNAAAFGQGFQLVVLAQQSFRDGFDALVNSIGFDSEGMWMKTNTGTSAWGKVALLRDVGQGGASLDTITNIANSSARDATNDLYAVVQPASVNLTNWSLISTSSLVLGAITGPQVPAYQTNATLVSLGGITGAQVPAYQTNPTLQTLGAVANSYGAATNLRVEGLTNTSMAYFEGNGFVASFGAVTGVLSAGTFSGKGTLITELNGTELLTNSVNSNKLDAATRALLGVSGVSTEQVSNIANAVASAQLIASNLVSQTLWLSTNAAFVSDINTTSNNLTTVSNNLNSLSDALSLIDSICGTNICMSAWVFTQTNCSVTGGGDGSAHGKFNLQVSGSSYPEANGTYLVANPTAPCASDIITHTNTAGGPWVIRMGSAGQAWSMVSNVSTRFQLYVLTNSCDTKASELNEQSWTNVGGELGPVPVFVYSSYSNSVVTNCVVTTNTFSISDGGFMLNGVSLTSLLTTPLQVSNIANAVASAQLIASNLVSQTLWLSTNAAFVSDINTTSNNLTTVSNNLNSLSNTVSALPSVCGTNYCATTWGFVTVNCSVVTNNPGTTNESFQTNCVYATNTVAIRDGGVYVDGVLLGTEQVGTTPLQVSNIANAVASAQLIASNLVSQTLWLSTNAAFVSDINTTSNNLTTVSNAIEALGSLCGTNYCEAFWVTIGTNGTAVATNGVVSTNCTTQSVSVITTNDGPLTAGVRVFGAGNAMANQIYYPYSATEWRSGSWNGVGGNGFYLRFNSTQTTNTWKLYTGGGAILYTTPSTNVAASWTNGGIWGSGLAPAPTSTNIPQEIYTTNSVLVTNCVSVTNPVVSTNYTFVTNTVSVSQGAFRVNGVEIGAGATPTQVTNIANAVASAQLIASNLVSQTLWLSNNQSVSAALLALNENFVLMMDLINSMASWIQDLEESSLVKVGGTGTSNTFYGAVLRSTVGSTSAEPGFKFGNDSGLVGMSYFDLDPIEESFHSDLGIGLLFYSSNVYAIQSTSLGDVRKLATMQDLTNVVSVLASTNSGLNTIQVDAQIATSNLVAWPDNQRWNVQTTTSNIFLSLSYNFVLADTALGEVVLTLPTNAPIGWSFTVANIGAFPLVVQTDGIQLIDGATNLMIATENSTRGLLYYGAKWKIYQ